MNNIDMIFSTLLEKDIHDIKNIVKYTRDSMYSNHDIPSLNCYNDDTYIEIIFNDDTSLCVG
jgi:hypothetical protein